MSAACVNKGGNATLVRLDCDLEAEVPTSITAEACTALGHWQVRPGMIVTVVDLQGWMWRARLLELNAAGGRLLPFQRSLRIPESPLQITVFQALPEKERFELILEKLTELGVTRIVPILSQHSSTQAERDAKQRKSHRWPEVLRRAAIQCRRAMIPELGPCLDLETVFRLSQDGDLRLIFYEGAGTSSLKDTLASQRSRKISLLIGPEGGFAAGEVSAARAEGFLPVSLGPRILRTETAAICAATVIQYALGDLH